MSRVDCVSAGAPLDKAEADVIILSSDNVEFRILKILLTLASPVFAGMFTLPQPKEYADQRDGLPIVPVTEDHQTVGALLRLCYPGHVPALENLVDVKDLLVAVMKYEMEPSVSFLKGLLVSPKYLEENPVRVYAIACLYGLPEEANMAARATLHHERSLLWYPVDNPELYSIRVNEFLLLIQFHERCSDAATDVIGVSPGRSWANFAERYRSFCFFSCSKDCWRSNVTVSQWWVDFMTAVRERIREHPEGQLAVTMSVNKHFIESAIECGQCKARAAQDLYNFSVMLSKKIEDAVSSVRSLS